MFRVDVSRATIVVGLVSQVDDFVRGTRVGVPFNQIKVTDSIQQFMLQRPEGRQTWYVLSRPGILHIDSAMTQVSIVEVFCVNGLDEDELAAFCKFLALVLGQPKVYVQLNNGPMGYVKVSGSTTVEVVFVL